MQRTVVIYKGKYGSTARYARWIAEALACPLAEADHFAAKDFANYDTIVFGGALQAGGIKGIELIRRNIRKLQGKKVILFVVGLNVEDKEARMQMRDINLRKKAMAALPVYYCMGAFDPSKISGVDRGIINMTLGMIRGKPEETRTESERRLYHDLTEGADYVDRRYIEPVLAAAGLTAQTDDGEIRC